METEIINVNQADMLEALNRSEVDMQISTAKTYPRNVKKALAQMEELATMDVDTAVDCFYALHRGKGDDAKVIEGLSVRMAEIVASCWGNLRVQARIIGNDGKTITAQAVCHDLESNYAISTEVKRRITDKNGRTYNEDMQVVTGQAACAIAFRNAVLKVVPKSVTKAFMGRVRQMALGNVNELETRRQNMLTYYAKMKVTPEMLCDYVGAKSVADMTMEDVLTLLATANAIKEGTTTAEESFIKPAKEKAAQAAATAEVKTAKDAVEAAKARSSK